MPDSDRQRQLLALAQTEVAASELGQEAAFQDLWQKVEAMLTSYSDEKFVSDAYARELSGARARARRRRGRRATTRPSASPAGWRRWPTPRCATSTACCSADLLRIEEDGARWRDIAETVITHAEDLVRVGYFDQALKLAESVTTEGARDRGAQGRRRARCSTGSGRGAMMRHAAKQLRTADDGTYERLKRLAHGIGPAVIAPLAEALSAEQDARSRRRLRDILVEFGAAGRESVQQLMNAANWEVRRTAAFLLREFGGAEGLKELQPLLTDTEPLVQREAIQALVLNGTDAASQILLEALTTTQPGGRARRSSPSWPSMRDERGGAALLLSRAPHRSQGVLRRLRRRHRRARIVRRPRRRRGAEGCAAAAATGWRRSGRAASAPPPRRRCARSAPTAAVAALREASTKGSRGVALGGAGGIEAARMRA